MGMVGRRHGRLSNMKQIPLRISLIYAIVGAIWIALSDILLASLIRDPETLTIYQTYKGWFFVLVTAGALYVVTSRNVAVIQRSAEELRRSEAKYRSLVETTSDWVWEVDENTTFTYSNANVFDILGYEPEEIIGKTPFDFMPEKEAERVSKIFYELKAEPKPFKLLENTYLRKDGNPVILEANGTPIFDSEGVFRGYRVIDRDITERKKAEEELREYERRFREMLEEVELIAIILDARGNITFANDFLLDLTGWQREEVIGKSWFNYFIPEERREEIEQVFHEIIIKGTPAHYENDIITLEGERRTIAFSNVLLFDRQGNVIGTASIGHDVTAERQAAEEIRDSRRQVLDILESITDGFFALDNDWRFTYVNSKAAQLIGRRREELLFRNMWEVLPELEGTIFDEEYHRAKEEMVPTTFEAFYPPLNKWFEVHAYPFKNGLSAYVSDITERKRTEAALRDSQTMLQSIIDNTTAVVYVKDQEGRFILVNRQFEVLFHTKREEIVGKTDYDILPRERADAVRANDQKVLKTGEPLEFEEVVLVDEEPRTYISIKFPLRDPKGVIYAIGGISTDITERKRTEAAKKLR